MVSTLRAQPVQAATNNTLNFQARLQTASGGIVPDGYYNVQFKLYDAASLGTNLWTETYQDVDGSSGTPGDDYRVRVKNGYLTVNLGSRTAFPAINWDQELWITLNIGGIAQTATPTWDGEMNPRLKLTGVPYAFKAGDSATLGGIAAGGFIQNTTSPQTANFNITGNGTIGGNLNVTGDTSLNGDATLAVNKKLNLLATTNNSISGNAKLFIGAGPDSSAQGGMASVLASIQAFGGSSEGIVLQYGGTTDAGGLKITDDGLVIWGAGDDGLLRIYNEDDDVESLTLNDAGNLGLGDSTPSYKIDAAGDINTTTGYRVGGTAGGTITCTGGQLVQNATAVGGIVTGGTCAADAGVTTVGTFSNTSIANGASIAGNTITFGAADATNPGMVSTGTQTFAGDKSFTGTVTAGVLDVTGNATIGGDTSIIGALNLDGIATVGGFNAVRVDDADMTNYSMYVDDNSLSQSPVSSTLWHDLLAFNKKDTPDFETYNGSWNAAALDNSLFAQLDNQQVVAVPGGATTAARWTWSGFEWSQGRWLNLGFNYTSPAANKTILVESSADGSTWTTRHITTGDTTVAAPKWFYVSDYGGDQYVRLTITSTNSEPVELSSIRLLSDRWGDQGRGSEDQYPYVWDADQRLAIGAGAQIGFGLLTIGTDTTTAAGGLYFGTDTNLYRSAADTLRTDDSLSVGGSANAASYLVGGVSGASATCTGGQLLQNAVVAGGIVTGGTCVAADGGVTTVGAINGQTKSANGAVIAGTSIYMQTADAFNPGLVSTGTQTFAGDKTFNGSLVFGDASTDRVTFTSQILGASPFVLQGATDNTFSTTVAVADPTSNNTITLPNASGTVAVSATGNIALNGSGQISLIGQVGVANGGTGASTLTANGVLYGNGTGAVGATAAGTTGQCLKATTGSAPSWGTCGTASSLQDAYDTSGTTDPQILLNNTNGGLKIRDGSTPVSGDLFQIQNNAGTKTIFGISASAMTLQNSSGDAMVFNSATNKLEVHSLLNPGTLWAEMYYYDDGVTQEAVFAAHTGVTRIGNGSGNILLQLTTAADVLQATKTATLAGAYSNNDYTFSRNLVAGGNSLTGAVVKIESAATGTNQATNVLVINETASGSTGNLIVASKSGTDAFKVAGNGTVTVASGASFTSAGSVTYTAAGAAALSSGAGTALTITGNAASTWSTTSGALTITSAAAATWSTGAGALTLTGAAGVNITATSGNVQIGSSTTDATATLLVLDSYNQSSDPSGTNGAMYYSTVSNTFRCYENGAWTDCLSRHVVKLASDVTDSSGSSTITDVTGLSFAVRNGVNYSFECRVRYTSAATGTGSLWTINGPTTSVLQYESEYSLTTTTVTNNRVQTAYNTPATANATSATTGANLAIVRGWITPSADGTLQLRFATEVGGSAVVAKAGSTCEWW